jgi:hypothetical protein
VFQVVLSRDAIDLEGFGRPVGSGSSTKDKEGVVDRAKLLILLPIGDPLIEIELSSGITERQLILCGKRE